MIDEKAMEAAARAVLHRRIEPDFFEVKDGAWTLDHDKVVAEAAITAYLQALSPGSTGETEGRRCEYCDGTGDVHTIDGEWRGRCSCPAGAMTSPEALKGE